MENKIKFYYALLVLALGALFIITPTIHWFNNPDLTMMQAFVLGFEHYCLGAILMTISAAVVKSIDYKYWR